MNTRKYLITLIFSLPAWSREIDISHLMKAPKDPPKSYKVESSCTFRGGRVVKSGDADYASCLSAFDQNTKSTGGISSTPKNGNASDTKTGKATAVNPSASVSNTVTFGNQ
jgi:hypothetical protein